MIMNSKQQLKCRIALLRDKIREDEKELEEDKELLRGLENQLRIRELENQLRTTLEASFNNKNRKI